jgi:uncharacterized protein (DUF2252 family)
VPGDGVRVARADPVAPDGLVASARRWPAERDATRGAMAARRQPAAAAPGRALADAEYLPRRTVCERVAVGERLRRKVPHERLAPWRAARARRDPVSILERQCAARIQELVPIRYGRMATSPFAFYRGAAAVMADDLSRTASPGLRAQLCGDAHLMNFGLFHTPERALIFGLNDFDETLPGPFEWDVKRLAASVEIAGREQGLGASRRHAAVLATVRAYREAMLGFAQQGNLEVWYARLPALELQARLAEHRRTRRAAKEVHGEVRKALRRDHLRAFDRLLETVDGEIRFVSDPPILVPVEELLDERQRARYVEVVQAFLRQYRESLAPHVRGLVEGYRFVHIARKVVGVGSVGTRAWVVLMMGPSARDPLLLQLKEAGCSVLEPYLEPTVYASQGRRVVEGQRFMQAASDGLLGWYGLTGWDDRQHDYYVRQLWDGKASIDVSRLDAAGLLAYGEACGWTLARGHARSGDRIAIAAYLGEGDGFDVAIAESAIRYDDLGEADHARLHEAIEASRVPAAPGV